MKRFIREFLKHFFIWNNLVKFCLYLIAIFILRHICSEYGSNASYWAFSHSAVMLLAGTEFFPSRRV